MWILKEFEKCKGQSTQDGTDHGGQAWRGRNPQAVVGTRKGRIKPPLTCQASGCKSSGAPQ
jgi:hypothetical protein